MNPKFEMSFVRVLTNEAAWPDLCVLENRIAAEVRPGEPPVGFDEYVRFQRSITGPVEGYVWLIRHRRNGEAFARAAMSFGRTVAEKSPQREVWFALDVLPAYRQRGIGRYLLSEVVACALREGKSQLRTVTNGSVPAGAAFVEGMGGSKIYEGRINQLDLRDTLNRDTLQQWLGHAQEFEVSFRGRPLSDSDLRLFQQMDDLVYARAVPTGQGEDTALRHETLARESEAQAVAAGMQCLVAFAHDRATRTPVGYSEVRWRRSSPAFVEQEGTGVVPAFRRRGVAQLLKAAVLEKLLQDAPEARFVRTRNATKNEPMLRINDALGFQSQVGETRWKAEIADVSAFLTRKSIALP